jgi:hypothetical protein
MRQTRNEQAELERETCVLALHGTHFLLLLEIRLEESTVN